MSHNQHTKSGDEDIAKKKMVGELVATTGVMHRVDLILNKAVMSGEPSGDEKVG